LHQTNRTDAACQSLRQTRPPLFEYAPLMQVEIPLALGTVGGLTSLHPMVKLALEMLEKPSGAELMQVVAATGLAQNFAALRSLTTTGIQEGHMKMHLGNIINQFDATTDERQLIEIHFENNPVSHASVVSFIENLRTQNLTL